MRLYKIHRTLFFTTLLFLPVNLGKHFIYNWAYIEGLLVDYLIPVLYVTDLTIILMLTLWIIEVKWSGLKYVLGQHKTFFRLVVLFLVSVFLSVLSSNIFIPSFYAFLRLVLYVGVCFYVLGNFNKRRHTYLIIRVLIVSVLFLSVLGIMQWFEQGSVFDNYYFFGEQPYSSATRGIAIENFFGVSKVPPYGTFRHPNVFAGYLSIILIAIFLAAKRDKLAFISFTLGIITLFLTFSFTAWVAFVFGIISFFVIIHFGKRGFLFSILGVIIISLMGVFLPLFDSEMVSENPSVYRRVDLVLSSTELFKRNPLFGVGLNNSTVLIEESLPPTKTLRFPQPVHNIFLLILSESGIFSLFFFVLLLIYVAIYRYKTFKKLDAVFVVFIFQFIILGSFDHYLVTIHQTQLLFWLTLGTALAYN